MNCTFDIGKSKCDKLITSMSSCTAYLARYHNDDVPDFMRWIDSEQQNKAINWVNTTAQEKSTTVQKSLCAKQPRLIGVSARLTFSYGCDSHR